MCHQAYNYIFKRTRALLLRVKELLPLSTHTHTRTYTISHLTVSMAFINMHVNC